jgi:cytochrome b
MTTLDTDDLSTRAARQAQDFHKVWDWPTRLFHWSLVAAILGAYATNRWGASYFTAHLFFGYATIVLVVFRIVWGFVGTRHARFSSFVEGPRGVLRYVSALGRGRKTRYAGHNPLGAVMTLILLGALGAEATLGLFGDDEIFNAGPLAGLVSKDASLALTSLHRKFFYVILFAIVLHVGAVFAHVLLKGEPLIRAMLTGFKPAGLVLPEEAIVSSRGVLAVVLLTVLVSALALGLQLAPPQDIDVAGF